MNIDQPPFDDTIQLHNIEMIDNCLESDVSPILQSNDSNINCKTGNSILSHVNNRFHFGNGAKTFMTVSTLLLVNLLNYMDRYTIAGVLTSISDYYDINNSDSGLIQTSFICTYMIFSPIFGYLGDRYTRKYLMAIGILLWSGFTFAASFVPRHSFWAFVLLRACVGIGEASYSTIAPTIIADLFTGEFRTRMLMVFYFAIPVGSGLGYIVGAYVADWFGSWQYALRVTPLLGVICVVLIILFCQEPKRGMSEGSVDLVNTDFTADLKAIFKNKSFLLSTCGFTCVAFVTGALALWAPTFMVQAIRAQGKMADSARVSLTFGGITVAAGVIGVFLGTEIARHLRRSNPRADPLTCAFGMLSCTPFLFCALVISKYNIMATWYVVIPTRRSTAEAVQILVSHAFGDAGSPYLIGAVADTFAGEFKESATVPFVQFLSLQYALYITTFICVVGGGFYLATTMFVERDREAASRLGKGHLSDCGDSGILDDEDMIIAS